MNKFRTVVTVAVLTTTVTFASAGTAGAATPTDYQVLCIQQTLPGGQPLPEVCIPILIQK